MLTGTNSQELLAGTIRLPYSTTNNCITSYTVELGEEDTEYKVININKTVLAVKICSLCVSAGPNGISPVMLQND